MIAHVSGGLALRSRMADPQATRVYERLFVPAPETAFERLRRLPASSLKAMKPRDITPNWASAPALPCHMLGGRTLSAWRSYSTRYSTGWHSP